MITLNYTLIFYKSVFSWTPTGSTYEGFQAVPIIYPWFITILYAEGKHTEIYISIVIWKLRFDRVNDLTESESGFMGLTESEF